MSRILSLPKQLLHSTNSIKGMVHCGWYIGSYIIDLRNLINKLTNGCMNFCSQLVYSCTEGKLELRPETYSDTSQKLTVEITSKLAFESWIRRKQTFGEL